MAILEKEVMVGISNRNVNYYKNKGYDVVNGEQKIIKTNDLSEKSRVKLTKICDICGKDTGEKTLNSITSQRNKTDGLDRCVACSGVYRSETHHLKVPYEKSLKCFLKENEMFAILKEFSSNNKYSTDQIYRYSSMKCFWVCSKCNEEYEATVSKRTFENTGCPYCTNRKINKGNSILSTHPHIAKLLKDKTLGSKLFSGSGKVVQFLCEECGHEYSRSILNATKQGTQCPRCSDKVSYPEKLMMSLLELCEINYKWQKKFEWSENRVYDFFIPKHSLIIEVNGIQHYKKGFEDFGGRSLEEEMRNDKIKKDLARHNQIENYITIDCSYSELDFIKNNILKSNLPKFINLNNLDWYECELISVKSLVTKACDLWNSGISNTKEISLQLGVSQKTARNYLKKGVALGLCSYDPKKIMRENGKRNSEKRSKKITQLNQDGKFLKVWDSAKDVESKIGIKQNNIRAVCRKDKNQTIAGGYKWMYKEDYDKYIREQNQKSKRTS